jgi:hypothetical protein
VQTRSEKGQSPHLSTSFMAHGVRFYTEHFVSEEEMSNRIDFSSFYLTLGAILAVMAMFPAPSRAAPTRVAERQEPAASAFNWTSAARWRHGLKKTRGTLLLTDSGVEFRPAKGSPMRWRFVEIQTFNLSPHRLKVTGYENRRWHLHGERSFRFDLESVMPPAVAAELAQRVTKPAENGTPDPSAPAFATLGARHRTRGGGTNGILRFRESGIDYVTSSGRGARSWRWADIQTLARPDAFHFRVGAYCEAFDFELKEPMSRRLFDQLWNEVYGRDLSGLEPNGGVRP